MDTMKKNMLGTQISATRVVFLLQIGGGAGGAGGEGGDKLQVILKSINLLSDQAQQPQQISGGSFRRTL
jgi:hypothetical protein